MTISLSAKNSNSNSIPGKELYARWIRPKDLSPLFSFLNSRSDFDLKEIAKSHLGFPIYQIDWGGGENKIMVWSQMHGNEATATLALIDLIDELVKACPDSWSENLKLRLILMLNPDGSELYQRRNALGIDLNRDAKTQASIETRAFFKSLEEFQPDWAFNLHDQRNIFTAGDSNLTATLSFLAPSPDMERSISPARIDSMKLCAQIHQDIEHLAEGHFGRYTDEFYPRAMGDNLMAMGIPNILFEAGAFPGDPHRSLARSLIYEGVKSAIDTILKASWQTQAIKNYEAIPENKQLMRDLIFRDVDLSGTRVDMALMLKQEGRPETNEWKETYLIDDIGDLSHLHGLLDLEADKVESTLSHFDIGALAHFKIIKGSLEYNFIDGVLQEH